MGTSDFDSFWSAYPRREGRKDAQKAWARMNPSPEVVAAILAALEWQCETEQWTKDDGQYVPMPGTYLRNERWTDERRSGTDRRTSKGGIQLDCPHTPKCLARWQCGQKQIQERQAS